MIADSYHETWSEAEEERRRRRADPGLTRTITRILKSPYGGYRVRSTPVELDIERRRMSMPRKLAAVRYGA